MRRLPGLDLLRAIAIVWVMLTHAGFTGMDVGPNLVMDSGWMGVDLFFALSGFLIGGQLFRPYARGEPEHIGLFYARRLLRTLPPYLVVVALYFTVPFFRERPTIMPLWQFLTFTENLFIDFSHPRAFSHVWSLCVEEQFYLATPLIVWVLMKRPRLWVGVTVCAGVLLGGVALRAGLWLHDLAPVQNDGHQTMKRFYEEIYYPTSTRLDGLLGGVTIAAVKAFRPRWWAVVMARSNLVLIGGLALGGVAIWLFAADQRAFVPDVIGYPILALGMTALVAAGSSERSLIGRWSVPGAGMIAAMAYSLYLVHKPIYHMIGALWGPDLEGHPVLAVLAIGGAALAGGGLLYVTVERPALILRDRLLKPRKTTIPVAGPAPTTT
jgi:peptidoglycan/LPS O-acetylase OafA/YrhL